MMMTPRPLSGTRIAEYPCPDCDDVTRISIAFAGRLAADLGAEVCQILPDGPDPLDAWAPILPGGRSSVATFLNRGKLRSARVDDRRALLVTNDRALAGNWPGPAAVLIRSSMLDDRPHSELTILAASGLLDVYGSEGRPPLPLPGHQAGYSAGIAAFNALMASLLSTGLRPAGRSCVSVVDVATWLNWKHYLACHMGNPHAGIGRAEDWTTMRCRDGYIALVFQDKDVAKLAKMTGDGRLNDAAFATVGRRRENIEVFNGIFSVWAGTQSRADIVAAARELSIPIGPVLSVADLLTDPQMLARDFLDLARSSPDFGLTRLPATWAGTN
ncbi:crotonobetainyl-CoA:carnitine CoA-transferase CaiB-like acyl-CoA transferase [Hoeflea marina]|uniref:Crotonobetainyl-CoA:carnitine CoA-transferase CaiB-like acyl-CoA transferase n=1 Tax=Hoeflea marina TaxID=274592 RepID=A0A317PJT3_9HYPH|nr:CoA transferase [Hoeflea marina]PWV98829.1 crotonobetainyl-CoA:carnitine CoA-transferase CaiB-like acyl-CoA transferase [Hoeflea marina]